MKKIYLILFVCFLFVSVANAWEPWGDCTGGRTLKVMISLPKGCTQTFEFLDTHWKWTGKNKDVLYVDSGDFRYYFPGKSILYFIEECMTDPAVE